MFFEPRVIKAAVLILFATYARKYGIKVYEFIIMDNHYHFLLHTRDAESLSNFMRTVNSQIARIINQHFRRDSQALRERFKSPVISGKRYMLKVMQYIWMNRKEVCKHHDPETDVFNSISWRLSGQVPQISEDPEIQALLDNMLSSYDSTSFDFPKDIMKFLRNLYNQAIQGINEVMDKFLENFHTIADMVVFEFRQEQMNAHRRQQAPPGYTAMPNKSSPLKSKK
jgi:REP element-mobilizing transposase RayT